MPHVVWNDTDLGEMGWNGSKRLSLKEERRVKDMTKFAGLDFYSACALSDPDAMTALVVVMAARNGQHVKFDEVDGIVKTVLTDVEREEEAKISSLTLGPAIHRALEELRIPADKDEVIETIRKHLAVAEESLEEGNGDGG